ncbi:hypothetical protein [Lentzea kentuckyensis]|uniref:hypothetical protein n=1 Tax=Lentzea kentuckyensis TaxID=360086 RepID=UPI000A3723C5|nr:hypothetical protein [Lentzea kentuckyensis]
MTAADFYLGRGPSARWIGSLCQLADPAELATAPAGHTLLAATSELDFARAAAALLLQGGSVHHLADGWPWSWQDSSLTGWCYAFDAGRVWVSYFGRVWFPCPCPDHEDFDTVIDKLRRSSADGPRATFPAQQQRSSAVDSQVDVANGRAIGFWELHSLMEQAARDTGNLDTALFVEVDSPCLFVDDEPDSLLAYVLRRLGATAAKVHALGINDREPSHVFARLGFQLTRNARALADDFWCWELRAEWWADLLADHSRPIYPRDPDAVPPLLQAGQLVSTHRPRVDR